jgi:hypothetical protein
VYLSNQRVMPSNACLRQIQIAALQGMKGDESKRFPVAGISSIMVSIGMSKALILNGNWNGIVGIKPNIETVKKVIEM